MCCEILIYIFVYRCLENGEKLRLGVPKVRVKFVSNPFHNVLFSNGTCDV